MRTPDGTAATTTEPVAFMGDKIHVHCPECGHLGTHTGTCVWSQARSGRIWVFYAEAIDVPAATGWTPDPSAVPERFRSTSAPRNLP